MMTNNKETIFTCLKEQTAKGKKQLTTVEIADFLHLQRSNVSALLNQLVSEGRVDKTATRPVYYFLANKDETNDCFDQLIGGHESLRTAVQLAKAAVLYPGHSLNTLIVGASGTGKSFLASIMFEYAQKMGIVATSAHFIKLNCRHYVGETDKIEQMLFGKFDGRNMFDMAENSFLFIDNINLLDGPTLNRLMTFIETGNYYYLNDETPYQKNIVLIAALDRNNNESTFQTLSSKIPVKINLPELPAKSLSERLQLISHFFAQEAANTDHTIQTNEAVIQALLLTESNLNIKYLLGAIKTAVANAYLRCYDSNSDTITVILNDFDKGVTDASLKYRTNREAVDAAIPADYSYIYTVKDSKNIGQLNGNDFYDFLNQKARELQARGLDKHSIDEVLNSNFEKMLTKYQQFLEKTYINTEQLSKIVDPQIIEAVTRFMETCSRTLKRSFSSSVTYGLCLHINAIAKQKRESKYLSADKVNEIINKHVAEYRLTTVFAEELSNLISRDLSIDEIVFLTLFIIEDNQNVTGQHPNLLICMHGESTARSVAQVINSLVKADNTYAYDMSLNKDNDTAYKELEEKVSMLGSNGLIVIYDMGSFKTMLERISQQTHVEMRTIYLPLTLIGIDASRKAAMEDGLDAAYHSILMSMSGEMAQYDLPSAIITLCHTGEGGAQEIKEYLQKHYRRNIKIIALAVSDRLQLISQVKEIRRQYAIKAFVGTYDPHLFGIPFVPVSRIFEQSGHDLDTLLFSGGDNGRIDVDQMLEYIHTETGLDRDKLQDSIPKALDMLDTMYGLNLDQWIGLFLHLAAVIAHATNNDKPRTNSQTAYYLQNFKKDMKNIRDALKKVEKTFEIIITDDEVADVFDIIRKEEA